MIKSLLSIQTAANSMFILIGLLIGFHVLIVFGFISPESVWGNKLDTSEDLIHIELASISLLVLFAMVVMIKMNYIDMDWIKPLAQLSLWMMAVFFVLTGFNHLLSDSVVERLLFFPISLIMALLSIRLGLANSIKPITDAPTQHRNNTSGGTKEQ